MAVKSDTPIPAYIPWDTFTGFIGHLKDTAIPTHIDKSMMPSDMPPLTRGQVQSALKFLGLIDASGAVHDSLTTLVESFQTDEWPNAVKAVIEDRYHAITDGLDITSATQKQVDDRFKAAGVEGQMAQKSLRFYLAGLKDAGLPYSPHLGSRRKRAAGTRKKPVTNKTQAPKKSAAGETSATPPIKPPPPVPGMRNYPLYFRGKSPGSIVVPENLTLVDCAVIELQVAVLKASAEET